MAARAYLRASRPRERRSGDLFAALEFLLKGLKKIRTKRHHHPLGRAYHAPRTACAHAQTNGASSSSQAPSKSA